MDITPIYELRNRLRAAAIAGTNLLSEDFRLKRAVEAMQPLEAASPVFARIGELARGLLSSKQADREGALLDTITLVDALLCTQGEVAVAGELQPLRLQSAGSAVSNAPYSDVKAILDALQNSGGGRYGYLTQMHEERPELFEDYRVKPALVRALGASYAELAEDVKKWLKSMGEPILPLLEKDFDPKGKKEMLRRVEVIDAIAGAGANDFYVKYLPDSEKEIRQALIYALRHSPENEELLLSLTKTEKGKTKKRAYHALACLDSEAAQDCIGRLVEKKSEDGLEALCLSNTKWAAILIQRNLNEILDKLEARIRSGEKLLNESADVMVELNFLTEYLNALKGKDSQVVCACVRRVAALAAMPEMRHLRIMGNSVVGHKIVDSKWNQGISLQTILGQWMTGHLIMCPEEEIISLAIELYETYKGQQGDAYEFFTAAVLAKLFSEEDCMVWLSGELERDKGSLLHSRLAEALIGLRWSRQHKSWVIEKTVCHGIDNFHIYDTYRYPIKQQVRGEFFRILLGEWGGRMNNWGDRLQSMLRILEACIPDGDTEYEKSVMDYFYHQAINGSANGCLYYSTRLKDHNYPVCEGIAVHYLSGTGPYHLWEIKNIFNSLPGSIEAKRAEGQAVLDGIESFRLDVRLSDVELDNVKLFLETMM